jgi:hypothetical protein
LIIVIRIVIDCLIDGLETRGEDGSGSVSRVLGSISRLFALLSAAASAIGCDMTLLAAFVAFDTGLDLLRALSSRLSLSFYVGLSCRIGISR